MAIGDIQIDLPVPKKKNCVRMNISEKVRIHTAASHLFLEKLIVGQIRSLQCKEDYGVILNLFHGYFAGLESRIEAFITEKNYPIFIKEGNLSLFPRISGALVFRIRNKRLRIYFPK